MTDKGSEVPVDSMRIALPFVALLVLRLVASFFPEARLWGVNIHAWLPLWLTVVISVVGVLFAMPWPYALLRRLSSSLLRTPSLGIALPLAVAAGALFWFARMETYFLGDGASYLAEHFRFVQGLEVSEDVLFSPGSAPLTATVLAYAAKALYGLQGFWSSSPQVVFWLGGALAGVLYVLLVLLWSRRASEDAGDRLFFALLMLATPGTLFFFGYVEYYTFSFVGMALTVLSSVEYARGRMSAVVPLLALVLSAALHLMSLLLLPGVLLALLARGAATEKWVTLRNVALLALVALLLGGVYYFASGIATEGSRVVLAMQPFGEPGAVQQYTLLSSAHLLDVINMVLLVAGPGLFALPLLRKVTWDAPLLVALTHTVFALFLLIFGYTCFGMARDWDVNASFGVVFAILLFLLLRAQEAPRRGYLLYVAACASLVAVLPWVLVNADSVRSEQRYRAVLALDERLITGDFALNGYEHLRKYYQSTGDAANELWVMRKKVELVGYPQDMRKLMRAIVVQSSPEQRVEHVDFLLQHILNRLERMRDSGVDSLYEGGRRQFLEIGLESLLLAQQIGAHQGDVRAWFESWIQRFSALPESNVLTTMARAQFEVERGGMNGDPTPFLQAAKEIRYSSSLASNCGRALMIAGKRLEARDILERAMRIDPAFTLPHFMLGIIATEETPPDTEAAIQHFEQFLARPEGHQIGDPAVQQRLMRQAESMLANLRGQVY